MQCACAILSSVVRPALQYFSTLSHKSYDFRKKLLNTKRVFWFYLPLLSETFPILKRNERYMIINVHWSSCKVPLFLSYFNDTWIFSTYFRKPPQISIFTKVRTLGSELFHADRRTDMTKLVVVFRNFAKAPTNESTAHRGRRSRVSNIPIRSTEAYFRMMEKFPTACS